MVELKSTTYEILKDKETIFYCEKCGFFGKESFLGGNSLAGTTFCLKCGSTEIDNIDHSSSFKLYNFFVDKINQIREIIDVKS